MFRNRTRNLLLALSLFAAIGSLLPGSHVAAAPIPAADTVTEVRWEVQPVKPKPELTITPKLVWEVLDPWMESNGITTYRFRLKAVGGPIGNIKVKKDASVVYNYNGVSWTSHILDTETLGTMYHGEVKDVFLMCVPPVVHSRCSLAYVEALSIEGVYAWNADNRDGNIRHTDVGF